MSYDLTGTSPTNNPTGGQTSDTSGNPLEKFSVGYCGTTPSCSSSDPLDEYRPRQFTGSNGQNQYFDYDTSGNLSNVADGASGGGSIQNQASLSYDPAGSDTAPRDGTLRSATDGNGNRTRFGYNSLRQLTSVNPPSAGTNGIIGTQLGSTSMTYDSFGRLATLTDGNGNTHTFSYDPMDRVTKDLLGSGDYIRYTYDADGNLTQRDERRGGTTTTSRYGYDTLNRRTSESFPSGQSNMYAYTLNSQLYTLTTTPSGSWRDSIHATARNTRIRATVSEESEAVVIIGSFATAFAFVALLGALLVAGDHATVLRIGGGALLAIGGLGELGCTAAFLMSARAADREYDERREAR